MRVKTRVKYWEIIADNLSKAGWSWGCVAAIDSKGRTTWIGDAMLKPCFSRKAPHQSWAARIKGAGSELRAVQHGQRVCGRDRFGHLWLPGFW